MVERREGNLVGDVIVPYAHKVIKRLQRGGVAAREVWRREDGRVGWCLIVLLFIVLTISIVSAAIEGIVSGVLGGGGKDAELRAEDTDGGAHVGELQQRREVGGHSTVCLGLLNREGAAADAAAALGQRTVISAAAVGVGVLSGGAREPAEEAVLVHVLRGARDDEI